VLRGDLPAVPADPNGKSRRAKNGSPALAGVVVGGIWRLIAEVDGRRVEVEEVGDVDPRNKEHDGERLKDAASDALKRCAMRLGLGLHLWAQEHYFLDQQLAAQLAAAPPQEQDAQTSEPGGTGERSGGPSPSEPTEDRTERREAPATATTPLPPDFDHLSSPGRARAWIRGQGEGFRATVDAKATEAGVALGEASLDDLRDLIRVAWGEQQAA
jgi:hypothetical protein